MVMVCIDDVMGYFDYVIVCCDYVMDYNDMMMLFSGYIMVCTNNLMILESVPLSLRPWCSTRKGWSGAFMSDGRM